MFGMVFGYIKTRFALIIACLFFVNVVAIKVLSPPSASFNLLRSSVSVRGKLRTVMSAYSSTLLSLEDGFSFGELLNLPELDEVDVPVAPDDVTLIDEQKE